MNIQGSGFEGSKVAFHTLGCKLNFSESSTIARQLRAEGLTTVDFQSRADVYVINTCSVTENADKKCRKAAREAKSINPDARVVMIGCYAQLKPKEIAEIHGVDLVLGAAEKFNLLEHLKALVPGSSRFVSCDISEIDHFNESYSFGDRTRAFLKVQDGCDYKCTFCTIPLARGASRSGEITALARNAQTLALAGVKEIVLTGVNIGDYGKGLEREGETLLNLLKELDRVKGVERFRISSIEPNLLSDDIIDFVGESKKFVPHFHIPLQSGSDKILGLMRRRYRTELYRKRIEKIKALMPDCCIGVDVIVGFPGETDEDFLKTVEFLKGLDISYLHVFTYSERKNTLAAEMQDPVPLSERRKRSKMLRILSDKKRRFFYSNFAHQICNVLFENEKENGFITGFTANYVKVRVPYSSDLAGKIVPVELIDIDGGGVMNGRLLPSSTVVPNT